MAHSHREDGAGADIEGGDSMIEVKFPITSKEEKQYDTELRQRVNAAIEEIKGEQIKAKEVYGRIGQMHYGVCLEILEKHIGG